MCTDTYAAVHAGGGWYTTGKVEILKAELARSKGMGYGVPNATGADRND